MHCSIVSNQHKRDFSVDQIELLGYSPATECKIPLFTMSVCAGIPFAVDDDIDKEVDLNEFLIDHPASTFFARIKSNEKGGVFREGDILIIDSSIRPRDCDFVLTDNNGEYSLKMYRLQDNVEFFQTRDDKLIPTKIKPFF